MADQRWIPVGERLPEGDGIVLLHAAHDSDKWITMGYRSGDGWYVIEAAEALGHHDLMRFTHWMPMPEPPTGDALSTTSGGAAQNKTDGDVE